MDIEKLIEQLRNNNVDNNCHDCALGYYAFEAADALSTLQAENEKLRAELEQVKKTGFNDAMNAAVCSANEVIMEKELRACKEELKQVKRERDEAIKTIFQWVGCPECKWWDSADEWCEKYDREADSCGGCESPEWRGQTEE